ncbi:unnamed protein product [Symbiodinium sp. KB8]|nr:unnamed protein product [Symbiodinium sp. KB8]
MDSMDFDLGGGSSELLSFLNEEDSPPRASPLLVTPSRSDSQAASAGLLKETPPSASTRASTEEGPSSSTPSPEEKKLPAPRSLYPGMFGKPGNPSTTTTSNPHPFRRALTSASDLSTAETPTKGDLDHMKAGIAAAKAALDTEKKAAKMGAQAAPADAAAAGKAKPGPKVKKVAERKANNDVLDLAAAVSSLVLNNQKASKVQQRRKLAQAEAKNIKNAKKAAAKDDDDDGAEGSAEEDREACAALEEYEEVNEDEELNQRDSESKPGKGKCKRKLSVSSPKGKAKAKSKAKIEAKDGEKSIDAAAAKSKAKGKIQTKADDGKEKKAPLSSFLGRQWLEFRDAQMPELKKTGMPYKQMIKEIAERWKSHPARVKAAENLTETQLKRRARRAQHDTVSYSGAKYSYEMQLSTSSSCALVILEVSEECGLQFSSGAAGDTDTDTFDVAPDAANPLIFKYASLKGKTDLRFTGVASYFSNRALLEQKVAPKVSMAPAQARNPGVHTVDRAHPKSYEVHKVLETPGAHAATLGSLYACFGASLVFGLFLWCTLKKTPPQWRHEDGIWDSDKLHMRFYILSALGYLLAGLATQFYPGDMNWAIQISKVVIILAWSCLVLASCGAVEAIGAEKRLNMMFRILGLVVVLAGLVEVVIPGDRHFQGFMWSLAAMALVCAFAWIVVWQHDEPPPAERRECGPSAFFRVEFHVIAVAGFAFVAIAEPNCGYAGHASCYDNCFVGPGAHFSFSLITFMFFYLALPVMQGYHPYPYVFPDIPCWRGSQTEPTEAEAAEQMPPSVLGNDAWFRLSWGFRV